MALGWFVGDRELVGLGAGFAHDPFDLVDDIRVLGGYVGRFSDVGLEVVELRLVPVAAAADSLVEAGFVEFPVEVFVGFLGLTEKGVLNETPSTLSGHGAPARSAQPGCRPRKDPA